MGNAGSEGWGRDFGAGLVAHARVSGHPSASPVRQLLGALLPSLPGGCYLSLKSLMCHKARNEASSTSAAINPALQEQEPAWLYGDSPSQPPASHTTGSSPRTPRSRLSSR